MCFVGKECQSEGILLCRRRTSYLWGSILIFLFLPSLRTSSWHCLHLEHPRISVLRYAATPWWWGPSAHGGSWTSCPLICSLQRRHTVHGGEDGDDVTRLMRAILFHWSRIHGVFLRSCDNDLQSRFTPRRARRNPREKHASPVRCAREDVVSPKSLN